MQIRIQFDPRNWTVGVRWATYGGRSGVLVNGEPEPVRRYVWVSVVPCVTVRVRR